MVRTKTYAPPIRHSLLITANTVINTDGTLTLNGVLTASDGFVACAAEPPGPRFQSSQARQ